MKATILRRAVQLITIGTCLHVLAQQPNDAPDKLEGLWGVEQTVGPKVKGELVIRRAGNFENELHARIAGFDATVERKGDEVSFALPEDAGVFRGHLSLKEGTITGHWIQPPAGPYNLRYASPVMLRSSGKDYWSGEVVPLDEPVSFYLRIQRTSVGTLIAYIRNPEANFFRRQTFNVEAKGSEVIFASNSNKLEGTYDAASDSLTLPLLDGAPPLRLTRRNQQNASGYFPRSNPAYEYKRPVDENDGWQTGSLLEAGLAERPLEEFIRKILNANLDENPLPIHSLLIARHGKLVLEEYFYGYDAWRPHDTRSGGKTWATVLVGVAMQQGFKIDPRTPVYPLFPQYRPFANWDERKNKITLDDIMTMTSGLACDDGKDDSPGNEDTMQSQTTQPDWYKYTLDLPRVSDPGGSNALYCSATLNLVGGAVGQVTGKWLPELFQKSVATPLQISHYYLDLMPTGEAYFGGGIYMRPRDLLKLAQLYLNGGTWNGKRIVSDDWVDKSTRKHSQLSDPTGKEHLYGYAWHLYHYDVAGKNYTMYFAAGNGGQLVMVFPELDMVANYNGGAYGERKFLTWQAELVPRYLIPAATVARTTK